MVNVLETRLRRAAHLRTRLSLINGLRLFWATVVLWCEVGAFLWSLVGCRWPDRNLTLRSPSTHVLIVADPQILDQRSYPGRPKWLTSLSQYIVDFNLRKNWNAALTKLNPHVIVFLGDMMDSGRVNMDDFEYSQYYNRFKSIFQLRRSVPVFYLPGNHDVNLGQSPNLSSPVRDRYRAHFGPFNQRVEIANHTLLMLDAPGLVDEDYHRHSAQKGFKNWRGTKGGTVDFLKTFTSQRPNDTVILFSHIPLSRSDRVSCGPLREKGTIHPGVGHGYQNLLLRETSNFVLENVRPSAVFSADDHDYCEHLHTLADGSRVREVTVKSFSMAMGVHKPGFQLLSLAPAPPATLPYTTIRASTFADAPCLLPDQIRIYTHSYAPLALVTVLFFFIYNYRHRHLLRRASNASPIPVTHHQSSWQLSALKRSVSIVPPMPLSSKASEQSLSDKENRTQDSFGLSPILESNPSPPKQDEGYPFPVVSAPSTSGPEQERKSWSAPRLSKEAPLVVLSALSVPVQWLVRGSGQRTWYGRAVRDLCQVAWPPMWVYIIISIWLFWR